MKRRELIVTNKATEDLSDTFLYIARENIEAAKTFAFDLDIKIHWIADTGCSGTTRDWVQPGIRVVPYRGRCIYYRMDDKSVYILRVLHERQDVTQQEFEDH